MSWLYWVDGEAGAIWRVRRDGTERQRLIAQDAPIDAQPADWLAGTRPSGNAPIDGPAPHDRFHIKYL